MPAGFDMVMRDGAKVSVRLSVVKFVGAESERRTIEIENLLCGHLAGSAGKMLECNVLAMRSTDAEEVGDVG